ncbi:Crp/Fnr family transcriptional regulator [Ruminococcus difficilis]|uniref:Crp/Fnr family transcriptional regulator n=1 Tax=Ruminococcus difficilis TaxID=2763069 RepID=A0A935C2V4_9FIRM|nr:Crp/Fnr family transcriptional regulator [Ruminococcus difficilis]MBK6089416.1 Crp/Fnr family transcriptional regulator [Ruminococcus difficilis]MDO4893064.1 Crp/Fnr family transcriptional regulator [Eubacteriales bacterium]
MITNREYLYSIRKCYLFDNIPDEQLADAIKLMNGRIKKIEKDDFIVQLGGELPSAGLLLKGRIESSFQNENFDQITMHSFGGGYLFGEALVINNAKNSPVQVRAVEDCIVLFIDLKVIYHSDIQSPLRVILTENLIKSLARKNLILNQKVRILSRKSLRERILFYLGTLPKDKNGWVKIPFNKTVLAEYLGVNRSALSRELGRMQDEEILISDGRKMKTLV